MHPENIPCLTAAGIDLCSLANNHVLDWGYAGLRETLKSLEAAGIKSAGAGENLSHAQAPVILEVKGKGRAVVLAFGLETSGISRGWAAGSDRAGVFFLPDYSDRTVASIKESLGRVKRAGDIAVASIHWGANWGYEVSAEEVLFAHKLVSEAGVDVIHGHSSHHVKGIEVYKGKLILYGCGDFLNDYEGIQGYEAYRDDLGLMYFAAVNPSTGKLAALEMTPTRVKRLRVNRASPNEARWLRDVLNREGRKFDTRVETNKDGSLSLRWD
jgi:poly-gamma-glutamate synthesis protein (capsule biosynthesis protein)